MTHSIFHRHLCHPHPRRALLIFGLFLLFFTACSGKAVKTPQTTPTPIPLPTIAPKLTYQVQRGEMINELKFTGKIDPATQQELAFTTSGRVAKVYVKRGDTVTKNQLLAELESNQSEYDLRRAKANLKIAQLSLDMARLQTPRSSKVYSVTIAIQEQEVALAQIALDELNAAYNSVRITSPISGTVYSVSTAEGNTVDANKPVMVVAQMDKLIVSANPSANDMAQLTVGMKANVDSVGVSIPTAVGTIQSLPYPYGSASGNAAQVTLDQSPTALGYKVGDAVDLTVVLEKKADALWLPLQAVREFDGRYFVILQESGGQRRVDIKVGITEADRIEIVDGLTEGQVVVAP